MAESRITTNAEILAEAEQQIATGIPDGIDGALARQMRMLRANGFDIVDISAAKVQEADRAE